MIFFFIFRFESQLFRAKDGVTGNSKQAKKEKHNKQGKASWFGLDRAEDNKKRAYTIFRLRLVEKFR